MTTRPLPWTGGCRCGEVRFQTSAPPLISMACHCTGCQRMTASAFSLSLAVPSAGFAVTRGEPVIGGLYRPDARHHFCSRCMSWLFTRFEAMGDFVNLRTTMLDEPRDLPPFVETMTAEKLDWAVTPAVHSFEGFPPTESFGALVEDYARHVASPAGAR